MNFSNDFQRRIQQHESDFIRFVSQMQKKIITERKKNNLSPLSYKEIYSGLTCICYDSCADEYKRAIITDV